MIPLAVLAGGALFLALTALDPRWAALVALAVAMAALADIVRHEARSARDRAVAMRRWREWHP